MNKRNNPKKHAKSVRLAQGSSTIQYPQVYLNLNLNFIHDMAKYLAFKSWDVCAHLH